MKNLPVIQATPEQLALVSRTKLGVEVICGAAGSGKTTTALLRLSSLSYMFHERHIRKGFNKPVRVLILTFNRTLKGYIETLTKHQLSKDINISLEIETFGKWAYSYANDGAIIDLRESEKVIKRLAQNITSLSPEYIFNEVSYLLGRFTANNLQDYISAERTGRGSLPRVDRRLRKIILDDVVYPYLDYLKESNLKDWNGMAIAMTDRVPCLEYDIIIVDESQDFSANQLRAIRAHLAEEHTVTFVIDTVQRIYARGFTWSEVGFIVRPENSHKLRKNYRNTVEIAQFVSGILENIDVDSDGALPHLSTATKNGDKPLVIRGLYNQQVDYVIDYIKTNIDLSTENVAFLQPKGKSWFSYIQKYLKINGIPHVDITREPEWPTGSENVALCTFHSAKGLEFDYVFILGLSNETAPCNDEDIDDQQQVMKKLLAVAVARARKKVIIGYKPGEESFLINFFKIDTYMDYDL